MNEQFQQLYLWLQTRFQWTTVNSVPEILFTFDKTNPLNRTQLQQLIQTLDKIILPQHQIEIHWYSNEFTNINQKSLSELRLYCA